MAKKAQGSAKSIAKTSATKAAKASDKGSAKKPAKAPASPKASAKTAKETKVIEPKKAAPTEKKADKKAEAVEVPKKAAAKSAPEKTTQATESSEKIKIDKSMSDEQVKWVEMYNKYRDAQAAVYDMKATFKAATAIQHKVLGWGWILSNDNDRLEVLFRDGKRMLISNYRG